MTDLDFWISEADAGYTDEVHPFWCFQQRVVFPRLCREARLWWVFERYLSNVRSTELQRVEYFSSALAFSAYSHGNWPPAARRGEVKHLHNNEIRRAAHAWLGPFIQLRCDRWQMKYLCLTHDTIFSALFFTAGTIFEGEYVDVFTMVKHIDYPRDRETGNIIAAVHPRLQVRPRFHSLF